MRAEVPYSQEFERIRDLPRRTLTLEDAEAVARELTPHLRAPGSSAELFPWQAMSLLEFAAHRGALLGLPVGKGKTLISAQAPVMINALRPVLVVPASLQDKTRADFASYLDVWRTPNPWPLIVTREALSVESGQDLLDRVNPDLIMIDECDDLANWKSAAARRIDRFISEPCPKCKGDDEKRETCATCKGTGNAREVAVLAMTGTLSRKSIKGYAHMLAWTLRDGAPIPLKDGELEVWAMLLDDHGTRNVRRPRPGPLGVDLASARKWYRERLTQTPGVVIVDEDSCTQPLTVRVRLAKEDPILDAEYRLFLKGDLHEGGTRAALTNPDGMSVSDPLSRWSFDGQAGCGLYLRYVPPGPPQAWRDARREVAGFVRDMIDRSQRTSRPLDSEAPTLKRYRDHPVVIAWREACEKYGKKFPTEAVWLSMSTIESALAWLREDSAPGIVWSGCTEFGEALATAARLPYYGPEGKERTTGRGLHAADPSKSLVSSWHANKKGFNLQPWRRMLVVHPPQSAKYLEQIVGRSHRALQDRPVVVDVLATSGGTLDLFEAAVSEALTVREREGMTQKVVRARVERATPRVTRANKYRWARRT